MNRSVYKRPAGPTRLHVTKRDCHGPEAAKAAPRPEALAVDKATECHVTPPHVARRMVEALGPVGDYLTLEPSAGTGNLARALLASGHSPRELVLVERHNTLAAGLRSFDAAVINRCFLEYAEEVAGRVAFPRVLMNPPFRKVRQHIAAALSLMGRNGHAEPAALVALVPVTFQHDVAQHLETLPAGTFTSAPGVTTKLIRITT